MARHRWLGKDLLGEPRQRATSPAARGRRLPRCSFTKSDPELMFGFHPKLR
jgi:hypothetical protein